MADNINLYELTQDFIKSKCTSEKNKSFIINYHPNNPSEEKFPYLYDETNYIFCLIKKNDSLTKNTDKDIKLQIKDSSIKVIIYKDDTNLKIIKYLLVLIVNDYIIIEKEEANKFEEEKIIDINNEEDIIDTLKLFLFDYIKENRNKIKQISIDKFILNDSKDNIMIYNDKKKLELTLDDIKKIKKCESNVQINIEYNMNDILDELNPKYRENLMDKYFDEMPEEIANLIKKYKNVKFNNEMYEKYIKSKENNNVEGDNEDEKKENEGKEKENIEENKDEGENTPKKKDKKDKKNKNDNLSSDKKQLFKIK